MTAIERVGDFYHEALAFQYLLHAMYNKPYTISSYRQLERIATAPSLFSLRA